jgi:hypothetical protein
MKNIAIVLLATFTLAGCGTAQIAQQSGPIPGVWLRSDGRSAKNDPALVAQFDADKAECTGAGSAEPDRICMDHRGYVLVPENEVEAAAAKLRAAHGIN